jgi:hypothetical protein
MKTCANLDHTDEVLVTRKKFMLYPDMGGRILWELFITIILVISCIQTPIDIAFVSTTPDEWTANDVINLVTDLLFLIDIFVCFMSAYENVEEKVIDDRKMVVKNYLTGWFFIDFFAILPIGMFIQWSSSSGEEGSNFNGLVRIVRLGKLTKLLKFLKFLRLVKIMKNSDKIMSQMNSVMQIGIGLERIMFFGLMFIVLSHITACLWIIIATIMSDTEDDVTTTWIDAYGIDDKTKYSNLYIYFVSLYYTVTTITTVGYGDIGGNNNLERAFAMILMLVGVTAFSFLNGALASIFQSLDSSSADLNERLELSSRIGNRFKLPKAIQSRVTEAMNFKSSAETDDILMFLELLPPKLRHEVTLLIYHSMTQNIIFLKSKSDNFKAWLCPLMRSRRYEKMETVFEKNDKTD